MVSLTMATHGAAAVSRSRKVAPAEHRNLHSGEEIRRHGEEVRGQIVGIGDGPPGDGERHGIIASHGGKTIPPAETTPGTAFSRSNARVRIAAGSG
jgi:hypothetical protein